MPKDVYKLSAIPEQPGTQQNPSIMHGKQRKGEPSDVRRDVLATNNALMQLVIKPSDDNLFNIQRRASHPSKQWISDARCDNKAAANLPTNSETYTMTALPVSHTRRRNRQTNHT